MPKGITSVEGLTRRVFKLTPAPGEAIFYRGVPDHSYDAVPTVFRTPARVKSEQKLYNELAAVSPDDFVADLTTLDKLVRMQHHSLPTRLLDITSNPLMALYFACSQDPGKVGQITIFRVREASIKFPDSDTASVLANLARLTHNLREKLDVTLPLPEFNDSEPVKKLLHFIRQEKPYFEDRIRPGDLEKILLIKSKLNNKRIISQAGLFFLFGHKASFRSRRNRGLAAEKISINASAKPIILGQLDRLNINQSTVFPFLENTAKYIRDKYDAS
jgi:hypothetical protein